MNSSTEQKDLLLASNLLASGVNAAIGLSITIR
jgi:hypothetical protein